MNIFYTYPENIHDDTIELTGSEAHHAANVMRFGEGDEIVVVDGEGGWYEGVVGKVYSDTLLVQVRDCKEQVRPSPRITLGLAIIKKRDRLEFAVEKAVELGASEIALFQSERTVKGSVKTDRLQSIILSAMKQSLRAWLPELHVFDSAGELLDHYSSLNILVAHEKSKGGKAIPDNPNDPLLLMVGPEGGFTEHEIEMIENRGGQPISLGDYRLRAETAVVALLSRFIGV